MPCYRSGKDREVNLGVESRENGGTDAGKQRRKRNRDIQRDLIGIEKKGRGEWR